MTQDGQSQRRQDKEALEPYHPPCGVQDCLCDACGEEGCDCVLPGLPVPPAYGGAPKPPGGYRNEGPAR
jgi:hypothetical protein